MVTVETIGKVRRAYWVQGKKIRAIARELKLARDTVRRIVRGGETERIYERREQPMPKLGAFRETLDGLLDDNSKRPKRERLTTKRIYEALRDTGYTGGYDAVRRYAQGAPIMHRQPRRPSCRCRSPLARPTSSTGATRS
jgi:transposase